jgi:hypothetical protein
MRIREVAPQNNWQLTITTDDGRVGSFDVTPFLRFEAFSELQDLTKFKQVFNGGYFIPH